MEIVTKQGFSPKEASVYTGLSIATLSRLRRDGVGARYLKVGDGKNSRIVYPIRELDKWLNDNLKMTAWEEVINVLL